MLVWERFKIAEEKLIEVVIEGMWGGKLTTGSLFLLPYMSHSQMLGKVEYGLPAKI